jgi:hypothetical protein
VDKILPTDGRSDTIMITFLIIMTPFALFGLFVLAFIVYDNNPSMWNIIKRPAKKIQYGPYDPESPQVKKFQKLAGIHSHRGRFNLRDM